MVDNVPTWVQRLRDKVEVLTGERGTNAAVREKEFKALQEKVAEALTRISALENKP